MSRGELPNIEVSSTTELPPDNRKGRKLSLIHI